METDITCPDCGKIIAPPGQVPESNRCQCAASPSAATPEPEELEAPKATKTCYVCGRNLHGVKRVKDSRGRYWCKECADADERAKKRQEELRCPDCGRVFPEHKLVYFQTDRVCSTCFRDRERKLERKVAKHGAIRVQKQHEYRSLIWMAAIAGAVLIAAVAWNLLR